MPPKVPFDNTTPWHQPKCEHGNYAITCYFCYTGLKMPRADSDVREDKNEEVKPDSRVG